MGGLRVLITNYVLAGRSGTETYVRDLALGLLRRGHRPTVFSTDLGPMAEEVRRATVPVVADLAHLGAAPDVIHGHHHPEVMTALLHFPGVPGVFVCHDRLAWHDAPPRFPRLRHYVAVDDNCRDRLVCEHGLPEGRVRVVLNAVDLEAFGPRGPLPARPGRALVFSHTAAEHTHLPAVRAACAAGDLPLDVLGEAAGTACDRPGEVLGRYDVVFAKGRCALEALAVGCAVILCDSRGAGPMVTADSYERLRRLNFGMRTLRRAVRPEALATELARYDPADASAVCRRVRAEAGLEGAVDAWEEIYRAAIAGNVPVGAAEECRAAGEYLRWVAPWRTIRAAYHGTRSALAAYQGLRAEAESIARDRDRWQARCGALQAEVEARGAEAARLHSEGGRLRLECDRLRVELAGLRGSATVHLGERLARTPLLGPCLRALARRGRRRAG